MAALVIVLKPLLGHYIIIPMLAIVFFLWYGPRTEGLPAVKHLIYHFERKNDIDDFPFKGAFWYNVGITIPIVALSKELAAAIIIILSLGDGTATLVGRFYGKHRIGSKSVEGFLSFLIFATLGAMALVSFKTALLLAFIGGSIEMIDAFDDNLAIPVGLTVVSFMLRL